MVPAADEICSALSTGEPGVVGRLVRRLERRQLLLPSALARLLLAAQRHEPAAVRALAAGNAGELLRGQPLTHYLLLRSLYWTLGLATAAEELDRFPPRARAELGEDARRDLAHMSALARLVSGAEVCRSSGESTTRLDLLPKPNLPKVPIAVNGRPVEPFIVDTGAPTTVLGAASCRRWGVAYSEEPYRLSKDGAGKPVRLFPALAEQIGLGDVVVSRCPVHVLDLPDGLEAAGILSPQDTFRGFAVELDLRGGTLRLTQNLSLGVWQQRLQEPSWRSKLHWNDGNLMVPVTIDGEADGFFLFDSGAGADILCTHFAQRLSASVVEDGVEISGITAGSRARHQSGHPGTLAVHPAPPRPTHFLLKDCDGDSELIAPLIKDGYVGLPWMEGRRLLLASDGRAVAFTGPAA